MLQIDGLNILNTKEECRFFTTRAIFLLIEKEESRLNYIFFAKILYQDEKINLFKTTGKTQGKPKKADQTKLSMEDIDIKRSENMINLR